MSQIRWNPYRNLISLPREIDRFFNDFGFDVWGTDGVWSPAVDITETKEGYEVKAEIPGMQKDEIKINYGDDTLTLSGERNHEKEKKIKTYTELNDAMVNSSEAFTCQNM